jgi:hypothetical protein
MNRILRSTFTSLFIVFVISNNISLGQHRFLPSDLVLNKSEIPQKIKKITQTENNEIIYVKDFDPDKNLIFHYHKQLVGDFWKDKYITMIEAFEYNNGKLLKAYHLHSNVGFSIWYYNYDSLGNNIKVFQQENDYDDQDSLQNKNPYGYISKILIINDLISHPKIKELESKSRKNLLWERSYDSLGNLSQEITYSSNGDTSNIQRFDYDQSNNQVYFYYKWSDELIWEYFYEYEQVVSIYDENDTVQKRHGKLIQSVKLEFYKPQNKKQVSEVNFYKYDEQNRLIQDLEFREGKFDSKTVFQYNNDNKIINRTYYIRNETEIALIQIFEYNKEGDIIKETINDYRTGEEKRTDYQYIYEYYK